MKIISKSSTSGVPGDSIWTDNGSSYVMNTARDLELQTKGLKDTNVTTAVALGDASNTALNTSNKTILGAVNELKNVTTITKEPTGFISPGDVVVTYNSTTRQITLTGTTTAYYRGVLISALTSGWVSTAHTDSVGVYFLYYDGTNFIWGSSFSDFSYLQIAIVNYRATNSFANRECHGLMSWQSHQTDHYNIGTYRLSGGDISGLTLNSTTAANRRPDVSACTIYDEDLPTVNASLTSKKYSQRFLSGASVINYTLQADDIVPLSTANPYYNSFSTPNYGQTLMPSNSVMTVWLYEVPVTADAASQEARHVFVQGQSITQAANSSAGALATAVAAEKLKTTQELNLGVAGVVASEFVCIHKFIIVYTAANWYVADSIAITGSRSMQVASPSGTFLTSVSVDYTLQGLGTAGSVLGVAPLVIANKTDNYTLVLTDANKMIEVNAATAKSITVPKNTTVDFPIGTTIGIIQQGAGKASVVAATDVTIRSAIGLSLRAQYSGATLVKRDTNEWYFNGDTTI